MHGTARPEATGRRRGMAVRVVITSPSVVGESHSLNQRVWVATRGARPPARAHAPT
ncbi:hypothetical protein C731_0356 [Mycolicibacterium hassiacum DSM 44199]|uniref:Uncharacterized protein n=1 Tax=Mycolicibacterium hassiacum (strain DSM 44199 / CIP 105218 / JCM 12690 / 3849) TaxID=1122247 RepID=K5BKY1_MYCHD|nr:hypothetical protein C731_0356 [Mycolicibacterium hassiacum DSM 44199]